MTRYGKNVCRALFIQCYFYGRDNTGEQTARISERHSAPRVLSWTENVVLPDICPNKSESCQTCGRRKNRASTPFRPSFAVRRRINCLNCPARCTDRKDRLSSSAPSHQSPLKKRFPCTPIMAHRNITQSRKTLIE